MCRFRDGSVLPCHPQMSQIWVREDIGSSTGSTSLSLNSASILSWGKLSSNRPGFMNYFLVLCSSVRGSGTSANRQPQCEPSARRKLGLAYRTKHIRRTLPQTHRNRIRRISPIHRSSRDRGDQSYHHWDSRQDRISHWSCDRSFADRALYFHRSPPNAFKNRFVRSRIFTSSFDGSPEPRTSC